MWPHFRGIFLYVHATSLRFCKKTVLQQWEQTAVKRIPHGHTGNPQQSWDLNPEIQTPCYSFKLPDDTPSITHIQGNQIQERKF